MAFAIHSGKPFKLIPRDPARAEIGGLLRIETFYLIVGEADQHIVRALRRRMLLAAHEQ
jgi:hypothetical protein